jgi:plastocyanin
LVWACVGLFVVLLVGMLAMGGLIPPVVIAAVLFLVAGLLARRPGKAGPIMAIVLSVLFLALNAPFIAPSLAVPASTTDFLFTVVAVIGTLVVLIAGIGTLRVREPASTGAPRNLMAGIAGLLILAIGVAVVARLNFESAVAAEGDLRLVTQDFEFSKDSITSDGGEVTVFVENKDSTLHTFTVEELDVDLQIPGGTAAKVSFEATTGSYEFICVPHESDMNGTLEVR